MTAAGHAIRRRYRPPELDSIACVPITVLVDGARTIPPSQQARLPGVNDGLFCVGDRDLARRKSVAVVGSRKASEQGVQRARQLARDLVKHDIVVVSGLAYGIDINAHTSAIERAGHTIAVIGTPVDTAYPAAHAEMQERIYRDRLLVSPFTGGSRVFPSNFLQRNKVMAAISDATCIVGAGETSGSLSQARECIALGRWLFILRSVLASAVKWPHEFLDPSDKVKADRVRVIDSVEDIIAFL